MLPRFLDGVLGTIAGRSGESGWGLIAGLRTPTVEGAPRWKTLQPQGKRVVHCGVRTKFSVRQCGATEDVVLMERSRCCILGLPCGDP